MNQETFTSRTDYKRAFSRRRKGYLLAGDRFVDEAPHEAPAYIRRPYSASQWISLTLDERRAQHRKNAEEFVKAKLGPMPEPFARKTITLSQLERLVIERADEHANDLRFILSGTPDHVEAIVSAQIPAFRARVFDGLVSTHRIVEG